MSVTEPARRFIALSVIAFAVVVQREATSTADRADESHAHAMWEAATSSPPLLLSSLDELRQTDAYGVRLLGSDLAAPAHPSRRDAFDLFPTTPGYQRPGVTFSPAPAASARVTWFGQQVSGDAPAEDAADPTGHMETANTGALGVPIVLSSRERPVFLQAAF
ncbi:MAG: hypothetical protein AAGF92_12490 [Myxococcota bacterium]